MCVYTYKVTEPSALESAFHNKTIHTQTQTQTQTNTHQVTEPSERAFHRTQFGVSGFRV
jgi:hypothetical protein